MKITKEKVILTEEDTDKITIGDSACVWVIDYEKEIYIEISNLPEIYRYALVSYIRKKGSATLKIKETDEYGTIITKVEKPLSIMKMLGEE